MGIDFSVRYLLHDQKIPPFSWFRSVVVSRRDLEEGCREIILHELSHVVQRHSWDILFANLTTIVLWFNPASWLVKRALQQVHEYCADESVIARGVNIKNYQLLLIKTSVGSRLASISNTLNHSNLKNRITMMLKKKTSPMAAAKCLYVIPMSVLALTLLSTPIVAKVSKRVSDVTVVDNSKTPVMKSEDNDEPYLFVDTMPTFNGENLSSFRNWCMAEFVFPKELATKDYSGRVVASFIIEKDGSLTNVEILSSSNELLSAEATRVLLSSPKWSSPMSNGECVRLKFTIPFSLSITPEEKKTTETK
ncbi:MAG: M56 family metallopeptidase [Rikenellaceae bacterium]